MADCPECDPFLDKRYEAGSRWTELRSQTDPLKQRLQEGLKPYAEAVRDALEARARAEAELAAWVQATAELRAEISAMTGAGATAVAGRVASDISLTPREGWIEMAIGTLTMWFRDEQAIEEFNRSAGLQAMLDALANAEAERAAKLTEVQQANQLESQRWDELDAAEARANEQLQAHLEEIAAAQEEYERWDREYHACLERCRRGEQAGQRVGVVGAALMLAGMLLVALANPFGLGSADASTESADETATATATPTPTVESTVTEEGTEAPGALAWAGPISATFAPDQFTTYYEVRFEAPEGAEVSVEWSGADCAQWGLNGSPSAFFWYHPHPPCDGTTDHSDRTIFASIGIGGVTYQCSYEGAHSGVGAACLGPGGMAIASEPGDAATPIPTMVAGTDSTPTATPEITATVESPTASATATAPSTGGGGGSTAAAPTPTATPSVDAGSEGAGTGGAAATATGLGLTVVGGAALGFASSRRGGGGGGGQAPAAPPPAAGGSGGTRARDREDGEDPDDDLSEDIADSPVAPITKPQVSIDTGGRGDDSVTKDQSFRVVVETPRPESGDPPETIDVPLKSTYGGETESLRLRWSGNVGGPARYVSEPITVHRGGTGGGRRTLAGFEFSTGDMGNDLGGIENGATVEVTYGDSSTRFEVYTTWVQQGISRYMEAVRQQRSYWTNLTTLLNHLPDSEEKQRLMTHARHVIRLSDLANRLRNNTNTLDTMKLAQVRAVFSILSRDLSGWDQRDEYDIFSAANRAGRTMSEDSLMRGLTGAVIGMWRTAADVTGYAAYLKTRYGRDEMGQKVGTLERIFAAMELAGKLTLYGQSARTAGALDDFIRSVKGPRRASGGTVRVRTATPEVLRSEVGRVVQWPEEFGMLRNVSRAFSSVAKRFNVRIRVRPANEASLGWLADGHPPKHVKLKSKTINEFDELIGAPPGHRGQVGYFKPELPPLDRFDAATRAEIIKRYSQRSMEFHDEAGAMGSLEKKGLVKVESGVVVDTGLSDTRLVGDELQTLGRNPGGTGKPFTGDHDMWDITKADGTPLDAATKAKVEGALADGVSKTQHGPHKDWTPETPKDRAIDARIRAGHGGEPGPDGVVRARPGAEALVEFGPGQPPKVSYEMGGQ